MSLCTTDMSELKNFSAACSRLPLKICGVLATRRSGCAVVLADLEQLLAVGERELPAAELHEHHRVLVGHGDSSCKGGVVVVVVELSRSARVGRNRGTQTVQD